MLLSCECRWTFGSFLSSFFFHQIGFRLLDDRYMYMFISGVHVMALGMS